MSNSPTGEVSGQLKHSPERSEAVEGHEGVAVVRHELPPFLKWVDDHCAKYPDVSGLIVGLIVLALGLCVISALNF